MSREFYVLRGGRVVYAPGHDDIEGARATAKAELAAHPKATVIICHMLEVLKKPSKARVGLLSQL